MTEIGGENGSGEDHEAPLLTSRVSGVLGLTRWPAGGTWRSTTPGGHARIAAVADSSTLSPAERSRRERRTAASTADQVGHHVARAAGASTDQERDASRREIGLACGWSLDHDGALRGVGLDLDDVRERDTRLLESDAGRAADWPSTTGPLTRRGPRLTQIAHRAMGLERGAGRRFLATTRSAGIRRSCRRPSIAHEQVVLPASQPGIRDGAADQEAQPTSRAASTSRIVVSVLTASVAAGRRPERVAREEAKDS